MPKLRIAICAVIALAILCLAVAVATAKRAPALTARVVEVTSLNNGLNVRVRLTNSTAYVYVLFPFKLEVWSGGGWLPCKTPIILSNPPSLYPHAASEFNWPILVPSKPDARWRLVIESGVAKSGLQSFLLRLRLRLATRDRAFSLNPFDPTPITYGNTVAKTEAFTAP